MDLASLHKIYRKLPDSVKNALPRELVYWAQDKLRASRQVGRTDVETLEHRLWHGFSTDALIGLDDLLARESGAMAAGAALARARWELIAQNHVAALAFADRMGAELAKPLKSRLYVMLRAYCLCYTGCGAEARDLIGAAAAHHPNHVFDYLLANSHRRPAGAIPSAAADKATLDLLNGFFERTGLQSLAKYRDDQPLCFDNLTGGAPAPRDPRSSSKVSVIVPVYNGQDILGTALRGLQEQIHTNIEILIVDDASTDDSADVAAEAARTDPRIRLLRQNENRGAYCARNMGLVHASGDYITVHDADDWSHPQKIAAQAADLDRSRAPFNFSAYIRATADLFFSRIGRFNDEFCTQNYSSGMFRRELFEKFGTWDQVRVSGDIELVRRFEHLTGARRRRVVHPETPLMLGRMSDRSLTQTKATHVATLFHGLRQEYREAGRYWHSTLDRAKIAKEGLQQSPPYFSAPYSIRPTGAKRPKLDVLLIGDFHILGGAGQSAIHMAKAARAEKLSAGILQYRRYEWDTPTSLPRHIRELANNEGLDIIAPGETLDAGTVIVTYPPLLTHIMDRFPQIRTDNLVITINQMAERNLSQTDVAYDITQVSRNIRSLFGKEATWMPISRRVQSLMSGDARYPKPGDAIWTPLLDTAHWMRDRPIWRGDGTSQPVVGRHGRDHPLKWPSDPVALRNAYCADQNCKTLFLGGASFARQRLETWPRNWRDMPFNSRGVYEFLKQLDVFLHFPDDDYIEEFGRAPMEAMAVGVPVILPECFRPTFADAALYAKPENVWPLVERLWRDPDLWHQRVAAGRDFVSQNCAYLLFAQRIAALAPA